MIESNLFCDYENLSEEVRIKKSNARKKY